MSMMTISEIPRVVTKQSLSYNYNNGTIMLVIDLVSANASAVFA